MLCNLSQNQKNRKEFHVETISKRKKRNKKWRFLLGILTVILAAGGILCGTGVLAAPVFPSGATVQGISVSEQSVQQASETLQKAAEEYKLTVHFAQSNRTFSAKELGLTVAALTALVFAVCCGYQLWLYAGPADLMVDYEHPGILLCAMGLLELLRRGAEHLRGLRPAVTYLAKISFGVYFIHILIMSLLEWNMNFDGWARSLKLLFLEGVSVGGSILLIALFSGIPFCRRRMFGIKG